MSQKKMLTCAYCQAGFEMASIQNPTIPARLASSSNAATRGLITRPDVNDPIKLPPSLKPDTSPNSEAATKGPIASRFKLRILLGHHVAEVRPAK